MVQVLDVEKELKEYLSFQKLELIRILAMLTRLKVALPVEEEIAKVEEIKTEKKPVKKRLLKLFNKAKYNAKYLEETYTLDQLKARVYSRVYGENRYWVT